MYIPIIVCILALFHIEFEVNVQALNFLRLNLLILVYGAVQPVVETK